MLETFAPKDIEGLSKLAGLLAIPFFAAAVYVDFGLWVLERDALLSWFATSNLAWLSIPAKVAAFFLGVFGVVILFELVRLAFSYFPRFYFLLVLVCWLLVSLVWVGYRYRPHQLTSMFFGILAVCVGGWTFLWCIVKSSPNMAFERDAPKSGAPLDFTLGHNSAGETIAMKLRTILIINTVIIAFASLAHIPLAVMTVLGVKGFETVNTPGVVALASLDVALLISCIVAFIKKSVRLKIIAGHAVVIALLALSIFGMVANIVLFGPPKGNYSFGFGLTTALCTYAVYLWRRVYVEFKGGFVGNYHWYTAGAVGVAEVAMFSRLFSPVFGQLAK